MNNLNPNFYMSVHTCSNMSNQRLSPGPLSFRRCKGRDKKNVPEALERFGKKLGTFGKILGKNYSFPILVCNILSNSCTTA